MALVGESQIKLRINRTPRESLMATTLQGDQKKGSFARSRMIVVVHNVLTHRGRVVDHLTREYLLPRTKEEAPAFAFLLSFLSPLPLCF
ncbi:hypothetical protein CCACVL1_18337 [Corchorus capsularis]|uniref:Uncharacterized protein n=1 Tax=Corchorus capsularis TaxID=210143 RepID=A0A1R3HLM2_COCAP|nr:hypothetical protein CCACVL1_18337 [Corchorus capsularis]